MSHESRVVTESLDVLLDVVHEFARTMENLLQWASGLASGISQRTPSGDAQFKR